MAEEAELALPVDFGKYRLEKRIATGGMAEIFLAHLRERPRDRLVIKRILPHLAKSREFVTMFLDEVRIASRIRHPNVVEIFDIGQIDGTPFLVMEYVHGEDIRRIYNRAYKLQRPLPLSHSIRVIADAALGLGYAHKFVDDLSGKHLGLVHRDVSPQNILVTYDGGAKVVDFGIAKAEGKVAQTQAGVLKGKYSYMSPEQALGDVLDYRTDIFALGIILYETTTGTRLFKRHNELTTLQAIIKCEFTPPSEALPNYPPELERILMKALARRPEDRWTDAEGFSAALYQFLHDSGLYVEREVIAEFMRDLFQEELEEAERVGRPALPPEDDLKQEMQDTAADRRRRAPVSVAPKAERVERAERSERSERAERSSRLPGFAAVLAENDIDATATAPEADYEDLGLNMAQIASVVALEEESSAMGRAEKRRSTEVVRARESSDATESGDASDFGEPEATHEDAAPDLMPTVAAQPSYRPSAAKPKPEKLEVKRSTLPVASSGPARVYKDPGERSQPIRRPEPLPRPSANERQRRVVMLGLATLALLGAVLLGILVSKRLFAPSPPIEPEVTMPTARTPARLTVETEPAAEVYLNGRLVGGAGQDGNAGPFEIVAGQTLVRVVLDAEGFERQRELLVEPGQNYHFEIRGRQGWLRVAVAPWARVTIDDKQLGLTPLPRLSLLEGVHRVVLENPEIKRRWEGTVRIVAGEEAELKLDLKQNGER